MKYTVRECRECGVEYPVLEGRADPGLCGKCQEDNPALSARIPMYSYGPVVLKTPLPYKIWRQYGTNIYQVSIIGAKFGKPWYGAYYLWADLPYPIGTLLGVREYTDCVWVKEKYDANGERLEKEYWPKNEPVPEGTAVYIDNKPWMYISPLARQNLKPNYELWYVEKYHGSGQGELALFDTNKVVKSWMVYGANGSAMLALTRPGGYVR